MSTIVPVFPTIAGGNHTCSFPLKRTNTIPSQVVSFINGSEQRWVNRSTFNKFVLNFKEIQNEDRITIDNFFSYVMSGVNPFFYFTLPIYHDGILETFPGYTFDNSYIQWTENEMALNAYDTTISVTQAFGPSIRGSGFYSSFPFFPGASGKDNYTTGYPFIRSEEYYLLRDQNDVGNMEFLLMMANQGSNYPSRRLHSWTLTLETMTIADANLLETHFIGCGGQRRVFSFTDPLDGTVYTSVRYNSDSLTFNHVSYGIVSVTVQLREAFGVAWTAGTPVDLVKKGRQK